MMALFILVSLYSFVETKYAPTSVIVIESTSCGNCQGFNRININSTLRRPFYDEVVNMTLIPCAHITETRLSNGTYVHTHNAGIEYLVRAKFQVCSNNLYSNNRSLQWATYFANSRLDINTSARNFFTEDAGRRIFSCVNSTNGTNYLHDAMVIYQQNRFSGTLPFIVVNKTLVRFSGDFLDYMCRMRRDIRELRACDNVRAELELNFLSDEFDSVLNDATENQINVETPVTSNLTEESKTFDYEAFWNSDDQ